MTIYATPFDPETRKATSVSTDSGFDSMGQAVDTMGEPLKRTEAFLIYPGAVLFSHVAFYLGERDPCL